ncbi:7524_t:CDS:2, partial [Scutellospora calospora]
MGTAHAEIVALTFAEKNQEKIAEVENFLKVFARASKGNDTISVGIEAGFAQKSLPGKYGISGTKLVAELDGNVSISRNSSAPLYDVKNKSLNLSVNGLVYKQNEGTLTLEVDHQIEEAFSREKFPVKKVIFHNNSSRVAELHDLVKHNLDNGEKNFTLENLENYSTIEKYEEMSFGLGDFFSKLTLKGKLAKPTQSPPPPTGGGSPPPNGPKPNAPGDGPSPTPPPTNGGPTSPPTNGDPGTPPFQSPTNNDNNGPSSPSPVNIENGPAKPTLDNLANEAEGVRGHELLRKLIAGEELRKQGIFDQAIYESLLAEKKKNSPIYQILNQQQRVDKLLQFFSELKRKQQHQNNKLEKNAKPGASLSFLKNMALFCKEFNNDEKAKAKSGELVNVEITLYDNNI